MTDARMPSRWLYDPAVDGLSDRAWRTFTASLMWSNEAGTDGALQRSALRFLHPDGVDDITAAEIITAGKWTKTAAGYQVTEWDKTQSLAADIETVREANRARQKAWRAANPKPRTRDQTRDITSDQTRDVTGESRRQGQDRQGQALKNQPPTEVSVMQNNRREPDVRLMDSSAGVSPHGA